MQINDICFVFEYNVETFRYYLVSRIWTILITQDNNQFLRCGLLYIFYSSLLYRKEILLYILHTAWGYCSIIE